MECFDFCPNCEEPQRRFSEKKTFEKCPTCRHLHERIGLFNEAHIPARYSGRISKLGAFETHDELEDEIGNLSAIKMKTFRWVRKFVPKEQGLLLYGGVGTGKTHLLAAIIRDLTVERDIPARFVDFTRLVGELHGQFDEGKGEEEVLEPLCQVPVLAVDELGRGQNTEWQQSILERLIARRYNSGLTTLFATSYPVDGSEDAEFPMITLRERVGEWIFSRLHEMTEFIEIDAPDFRKQ